MCLKIICLLFGGAENAVRENAGPENGDKNTKCPR